VNDRAETLELHGRTYAGLHLAIAFTDGIEGEGAKIARGWKGTKPLSDPEFAAGYLAARGARRNPVVVLGTSNLIGVDVDGEQGRALLRRLGVEFPRTVTVVSGRTDGGCHLWYRRPTDAPIGVVKVQFSREVTVSADGYFVVPPALHPEGRVYSFLEGREPWTIEIAELPPVTIDTLAREARLRKSALRHEDGKIGSGDRHEHLRQISWAMRRYSGASQEAIEAALLAENELRCRPQKAEHLVRALAEYTYENVNPIGDDDE
jgi:hypothetical protein